MRTLRHLFVLIIGLSSILSLNAQDASSSAKELSLEHVLHLYEGVWNGSIDLTTYHGKLMASMVVEKEYRLIREDDGPVLLGRFVYGQQGERHISLTRTTIQDGKLLSVISQAGQESTYLGTLKGDRIEWAQTGKAPDETTTFFDRFMARGQERSMITQSRNVIRNGEGESLTVFTAGSFLYKGLPGTDPIEDWLNRPLEGIPLDSQKEESGALPKPLKTGKNPDAARIVELTEQLRQVQEENAQLRAEIERLQGLLPSD